MKKVKTFVPSHHEVGKIAKKEAESIQPSIKKWLNKSALASQKNDSNNSLGACIANTADNTKINKDTISFENKVRKMNIEYNNKITNFRKIDETFKIITANVNSIITLNKRQKIWNLLKSEPDILLMTDTRVKEQELASYGGTKRVVISTNTDFRGVAFIIKKCYEPEKIEIDNDSGNLVGVTFKLAGKTHGMLGIYGPCEDNVQFYETKIKDSIIKLKNAGATEIIIAGDLNIQQGEKIGYAGVNLRKKTALLNLCVEHQINDHVTTLASQTNTNPISFWRKNTEERTKQLNHKYQASRLDHVLTTYPAENIYTKYTRFYPSDHAVTETTMKIKSRSGQTPWRLNTTAIDDPTIQIKIKKMIHKLTKNLNKASSKIMMSKLVDQAQSEIILKIAMNKWTTLVNYTKKITSAWARKTCEERKSEIMNLNRCMNNLNLDNETFNELAEEFGRYEIEKYKIKTELYKFKNKFENKRLLKYKAHQNMSNRTMKKIKIEGDSHENDKDIRKALTDHFTSVFSCDCEKNEQRCLRCTRNNIDYIKNINTQKMSKKSLSNSQKKSLEKPVDEQEVEKYVKSKLNKEGKAPGPDGIPYTFIYKFWPNVRGLVNKIVLTILNQNIMPETLPEGLVIFLPKPGKNQEVINGWRPLTMLNSIYKICSGIMAKRLDGVIDQVIHEQQYGFVKKRQAADVIEILNQIVKNNDDKTIAVVGMDFRGAFDTVKHEAIIRALKRKNFGPNFIKMAAILLANNNSTISVNGRIDPKLEKVKVKRSARQGDPLSPFLFILVLDELLEMIYESRDLTGINIRGEEIKGIAFADDNYTALQNTRTHTITNQIKVLMKIMKKFKSISGLDINVSKSEILTNDQDFKDNKVEINGIEIKTSIKSLGVEVGRNVDLKEIIKTKLERAMVAWNKMKLNYVEKIDVVNYILIPKVIHIMRHSVMNFDTIRGIKKSIKTFVFGGNKKVGKDEVIFSNVKDGGWGLRSIEVVWAQLLARWTLRSLKMENSLILRCFREFIDNTTCLDTKDPESTGHGSPITKNKLYDCDNMWENSYRIVGWIVQKKLKEKICYEHQPLLYNKTLMKQGKIVKKCDLPEIDLGPVTDVESLKGNRIEIFRGEDENDKKLTRRIFLNLSPTAPLKFPPCGDECRPPMRDLMSSKKLANTMIRSALLGNKIDTGEKAMTSMAAYTGIKMSQQNFKNHLKISNPKKISS